MVADLAATRRSPAGSTADLVTISGTARLLPRAKSTATSATATSIPIVAGSARVRGDVTKENWLDSLDLLPFVGISAYFVWLAIGISMAILGSLLLLIAPRAADAIEARSRERVGPLIAIGIAIGDRAAGRRGHRRDHLVGLPLAFVILLALLPLGAVAYCASAWVLGRRIVRPPRNRILAFLAGLAILRVLALVPILGFLVGIAAAVFGLGLIGAAIGAAREGSPAWRQSPDS